MSSEPGTLSRVWMAPNFILLGDDCCWLLVITGGATFRIDLPAVDKFGEKETDFAILLSDRGDLGEEVTVLRWEPGDHPNSCTGLEVPLVVPAELRSGVLTASEAGLDEMVCDRRRGGEELVVFIDTVFERSLAVIGGLGLEIVLLTATSLISFL